MKCSLLAIPFVGRLTFITALVPFSFSSANADPVADREAATKQLLSIIENEDTQSIPSTQLEQDKEYKIIEHLLRQKADINAIGPNGDSVLQEVMDGKKFCEERMMLLLADNHPNLNYQDSNGKGLVARSMDVSAYKAAQKFISVGAPVDAPDKQGVTPLMWLAQCSLIFWRSPGSHEPTAMELVELLLAKGADPERRDNHGKSAIDRAIDEGDYDLLLLLDPKGTHRDAYPEVMKKVRQRQLVAAVIDAIFYKAKSAQATAVVKKLLNEGADPNGQESNFTSTTIFEQALRWPNEPTEGRRLAIVKILLDYGADSNKPFSDRTIPLEVARHEPDVFALLLARGAKLNRNLELAKAASQSEIEGIWEAIFRHQFEHNASDQQSSAKAYFLEVFNSTTGSAVDPSSEFLKRFANNQPRVSAVSKCKSISSKGVIDIKTGEQGLIFKVGEIRWLSETDVEVSGGYYEGNVSASGNTYTLQKKDGKWIVVKDVMNFIS